MKKFKHALQGYFNEVEEGADGGSGIVETIDEIEVTPEDAVLSELGIEDAVAESLAPLDAAPPVDAAKESAAKDSSKEAEQKTEAAAKSDSITEADLAPLESKNTGTNERFRKVTEGYKQEKQRADSLEEKVKQGAESFDALRQLGFSDESAANDLIEFSSFRKALLGGDVETVRKSIAQVVKNFEAAHGKRVAINASALDDHPDLREQVDSFEIPEQTALELIRSRKTQEVADSRSRQLQAQESESNQRNEVVSRSVDTVKQMQANWENTDPDFIALIPMLTSQMEDIAKNFPPEQWPQIVQMQYKTLKTTLAGQAAPRRISESPLRGNGHRVGQATPSTPHEAVLQELGLSD